MSETPAKPDEVHPDSSQIRQSVFSNVQVGGNVTIRDINLAGGTPAEKPLEIAWHEVSLKLLKEQLLLTTNPMTKGEGIAYEVEQVYVPLGLVERKKVPRRTADILPEYGSELYWEGTEKGQSPQKSKLPRDAEPDGVEITKQFEFEQFLEQVVQQAQSLKNKGKQIAIIGEPGAGKTTLLQQIGCQVSKTFSESIVIWVSLADLQGDKLETYLEQRWLKRVVREAGRAKVAEADTENFGRQFNQGRVWLLLDGLDEMQTTGNPLSEMQRQIQEGGWLQQARILLTCRVNLWDSNRNALENFDCYRTLEFVDPGKIEQFIEKWFAPRGAVAIKQGQALCEELKEPGKERIRDLVKNPLRLTLLCFNWYLKGGHLPKTQAELYQRFVDRFYDNWKAEEFPTTPDQRQGLNRALAQLSLAAIDDQDEQGKARFRLRHRFVQRFLKGTLFDLALQLGWLNQVGVDADDPTQAVYAFYHTTFEEYFAALAIDDWDFFLPRNHKNKPVPDKQYRVFEPQWKEVMLLWLGREDVDKEKKEQLIRSLVEFKDGCKGFYSDRAFLLAAEGISEFKNCTRADEIVNQLLEWRFGNSLWMKQRWVNFISPARVEIRADWAETTFKNTDLRRVIRSLVRVLKTTEDVSTYIGAIKNLCNIGAFNETGIRALVQVLETTQDESTRQLLISRLSEVGTGNQMVIRALVQVLETTQDESTRQLLIECLGKIGAGNETAIRALVRMLETTQDESIRWVSNSLGKIGAGNEMAIQALIWVLKTKSDESIRWETIETLGKISTGNEMAIRELVQVLDTADDKETCVEAAYLLGIIDPGNEIAIRELVEVYTTAEDEDTRVGSAYLLGSIDPGNEIAIRELVQVLDTAEYKDIRQVVIEDLGKIGAGNETAIRELIRALETTPDESTRQVVIETLGKIGAGNETAIRELIRVLETTPDESTRQVVIETLGKIGAGNETVIRELIRVLETTPDESTRQVVIETLGKIGAGNETVIRELIRVLETTPDESTRQVVIETLGKIGAGNETAIQALVRVLESTGLESTGDASTYMRATESLSTIDPGNETAIQVMVRVFNTTHNENTLLGIAFFLSDIFPDKETVIQALGQVLNTTQFVRVLNTAQDTGILVAAAYLLGIIDPGNETAIQLLVQLLDKSDFLPVSGILGKTGFRNQTAIRTLVRSLRHHLRLYETQLLMMECAEALPYPFFYQAFHSARSPF
jgi:HEAT repeat protein/energy-coupling factor transporter ATP-binding protein EcfA2